MEWKPHKPGQDSQRAPSAMRLSFLCHEFPPIGGGAATALDELTKTLARRGHAVQIITIGLGDRRTTEIDDEHRQIVRLGAGRKKPLAPSAWHLWRSYRALRRAAPPRLVDFQPQLLVAFFAFPAGRAALSLKRRLGIPLVTFLRGSDVPGFSADRWGALQWTHQSLVRPVWQQADLLLANGRSLVRLAEQFMATPKPRNLANGVDTGRFRPPVQRAETEALRVLYVGQLIERKRCRELVAAMEWLGSHGVSARLTVVGDGPLRAGLQSAIDRMPHNVDVQLVGALPRHAVRRLYQQHDVLVHLSRAEGISNVLLEALSSGLCVVATRAAAAEVCPQRQGGCMFVDSLQPSIIGDTLRRLAEDPQHRRRLQHAARSLAEQHQWPRVAMRFEQHVEGLLRAA